MLVGRTQLPAANALMQGSQQLTGLIGPAMAGVLIAAVQTGSAFAIDSVSFVVASVALLLVVGGRRARPNPAEDGKPAESLLTTIRTGITEAMRDPAIRTIFVLTSAFNLAFTGPVLVGIAWAARDHWGGSAVFGILFSAFGAGALVGAIGAGSMGRVRQIGWATLAIAAGLGIGLAAVGFAPNAVIAFIVLLLMGLGIGFINVRSVAWLQARVPDSMRGRIMGLVSFGSVSLGPISLVLAGLLVEVAATAMFVAAGAIVILACALGVLWGLPAQMQETDAVA